MTLRIGNRDGWPSGGETRLTVNGLRWKNKYAKRSPLTVHRSPKRGFTLVEVLVTVAILSLGSLLIYEAFFTSFDAFNYCANYVYVLPWIDEKIWEVQENIRRLGSRGHVRSDGEFVHDATHFLWHVSRHTIDAEGGLYGIDLTLSWQEGFRKIKLKRKVYALFKEETESDS